MDEIPEDESYTSSNNSSKSSSNKPSNYNVPTIQTLPQGTLPEEKSVGSFTSINKEQPKDNLL